MESVHAHLERHLPRDGKILDLGAGAFNPLPPGFPVRELVGVDASAEALARNKALSSSVVLDLNDPLVTLPFEGGAFDAVVCVATAEFLTEPRRLFREVFRVLRPGGVCQIVFASKGTYTGDESMECKYWSDFNDAQKLYVAGSFFQFSSGGWSQLKGYDLSKTSGQEASSNPFAKMLAPKSEKGVFSVSSVKAPKPPPDASPMRTLQAALWEEERMLPDERRLCCERLNTLHEERLAAGDEEGAEACIRAAAELGNLYDILLPMDKVAASAK